MYYNRCIRIIWQVSLSKIIIIIHNIISIILYTHATRTVLLSGLEQRAVESCACVVIIIIQRSAIEKKKNQNFNTIIFPFPRYGATWNYTHTRIFVYTTHCCCSRLFNYYTDHIHKLWYLASISPVLRVHTARIQFNDIPF